MEKPTEDIALVKQESLEKAQKVLFEKAPEIAAAYIAINNGEKNIMSLEVLAELKICASELKADKETKFVIFHSGRLAAGSEGEQAVPKISSESAACSGYFSTGANVREMSQLSKEEALEYSKYGQSVMKSIQDLDQVTIAVIPKGFCVGGGLELSMSCKYRIANDGSIFQMPEKKLGIIPGWRGTQTLPYHIGAKEAENWLNNNGKSMKAEKALELGLIDYIFPNPLGTTNSMIVNNDEFVSRSKHDSEKMVLDGKKIETDGDEATLFAEGWNNGTPEGMVRFLEKQK
jgi:enoyl-CoA hydratase/carnithine racemase